LIVGLGNPGDEHAATRHNVGFMVAAALGDRWGLGRAKKRFRGWIVEGAVDVGSSPGYPGGPSSPPRPRVAVLCPQTYMNEVGRSVGPARGAFKLALERVVVVHDEIDLPFGEVRTRMGGGLAGHNGLKSIKRELGGGEFWRVRVGVGRPDSTDPELVSAYVLGRFSENGSQVSELIERASGEVERLVLGATPAAGEDGDDVKALEERRGERAAPRGGSRQGGNAARGGRAAPGERGLTGRLGSEEGSS
jgi:PTH1 family peptidyl-tRNA hydrolase